MKQLEKTPKIVEALRLIEPDLDLSKVAVFEAEALNTLPVSKRGSIYDKARHSESTLKAMAAAIIASGGIALAIAHDMQMMAEGKVFKGEVFSGEHGPELRVLFYVLNSDTKLVEKLDTGIIDEVSVTIIGKALLCSECGWDFLGADATMAHFWDRTCANEHEIGIDGVHLTVSGLDTWYEMSLVQKGAAKNPKIQSKSKTLMAGAAPQRLAASGIALSAAAITSSPTKKEKSNMADIDVNKMIADLTAAQVATHTVKAELATAQAQLTASQGEVTTLKTQLAAAEKAAGDAAPVLAENKTLKDQVTSYTTFLTEQATKLQAALGKPGEAVPTTIAELQTFITESQVKLGTLFPKGGAAASAGAAAKEGQAADLSAFSTRKQ